MNSSKDLVSIIITSKNEGQIIERLFVSVEKQSYQTIEIILVDNFSADQTCVIAGKFTKKVYQFGPERSAQRNFGAKKAKGNYLLFLDADMELTSEVVRDCVKKIKGDKAIGAVFIPEVSVARTYWEKVKAYERSFYNESGDTVTDAARFFTREVFEKAGGYDETITGPEDWDLSELVSKSGNKIVRITSVIYHHERINSPLSLAKKKYYYGLRAHRYFRKHKVSPVGAKTVYFLRPVFYRQWKKLISHPLLTIGMMWMMTCEMAAGGFGYGIGKIKDL